MCEPAGEREGLCARWRLGGEGARLQLLLWWDAYTEGKGGELYDALLFRWLPSSLSSPAAILEQMPQWDT